MMRANNNCFCHECHKWFHSLGIARHRAMHRDEKIDCEITYSDGRTLIHKFSHPVEEKEPKP